jgi:hypothetical protein
MIFMSHVLLELVNSVTPKHFPKEARTFDLEKYGSELAARPAVVI